MKKSYTMFAVLMTCVATQSAFAVNLPGWNRPLARAQLKIEEATGVLAETKSANLLMKSQDGAQGKVSFVLTLDQQAVALTVESIEDDCGSVVYKAVNTYTNATAPHTILTVMDNTNRLCKDRRDGTWEVTYEVYEQASETSQTKEIGRLSAVGEPQAIFTIQKMPIRTIQPLPIGY